MAKKSKKNAGKNQEALDKKPKSKIKAAKKAKSSQKGGQKEKPKTPKANIKPEGFIARSSKVDVATATATFEHMINAINELENKPIPFNGDFVRRSELATLKEIARSGPISLTGLAARLGVSKSGVLKNINKLSAKGLITKRNSQENPRALSITLTDEGKEFVEKASDWSEGKSKPVLEVLGKMSEDELAFFNAALEKIIMSAKLL